MHVLTTRVFPRLNLHPFLFNYDFYTLASRREFGILVKEISQSFSREAYVEGWENTKDILIPLYTFYLPKIPGTPSAREIISTKTKLSFAQFIPLPLQIS